MLKSCARRLYSRVLTATSTRAATATQDGVMISEDALPRKSEAVGGGQKPIFQKYTANTGEEGVEVLKVIARRKDDHQTEFIQAVDEVLEDLAPVFDKDRSFIPIMRVIMEPERVIKFRVPWIDDQGLSRVNRGYRVQYSSALGPYKGGLRFHPTVLEGIIKFLGFEQIFKNALTTLPMGGGKGGADFDPKGKSEAEVMRFCQSFMTELSHYIGRRTDVPAGDIGVGGREIGYMFGQYKRMTSRWEGVLTGKGPNWGGSLIRPEATGYGCVFFAREAMKGAGIMPNGLSGAKCTISGSGNVAQYTAEKLLQMGAIPLTFSDSSGYIIEPNGFSQDQVNEVMRIKGDRNARVSEYCDISSTARFVEGKRPWEVPCDIAFPSATQNEVNANDAEKLVDGGCKALFEGANMPSEPGAVEVYYKNNLVFGPGKAANAGGVAVSGLEMAQNAQMAKWSREEVENKLDNIMCSIYSQCHNAAEEYGKKGDLKFGANAAGFVKVANAVREMGM